jgi:hypothetical protein
LGALNVASYLLLLGGYGQGLLLADCLLPPHAGRLLIGTLLLPCLVPWVTTFTITFCRVAPCGPRMFRRTLFVAMCWYVALTLCAALLYAVHENGKSTDTFGPVIGAVLILVGLLSFVPFVGTYRYLHRTFPD